MYIDGYAKYYTVKELTNTVAHPYDLPCHHLLCYTNVPHKHSMCSAIVSITAVSAATNLIGIAHSAHRATGMQ